jgi:N-acetyl-anhydromuramyl-L-alanine amidase AmpD
VDIPYHYLIDLEGNIYEGRPAWAIGDTATDYDPTGHILITLLGNYDKQTVDPRQLEAIVILATWLSASYSISPQHIVGHRDYALTSCPGDSLYSYLASGFIAREVAERLLSLP